MSSVMANNKTTNKAANPTTQKKGFSIDLKTWGPFVALLALALLGVLINPAFLGLDNLSNMLTRSAFIGIIAIGEVSDQRAVNSHGAKGDDVRFCLWWSPCR